MSQEMISTEVFGTQTGSTQSDVQIAHVDDVVNAANEVTSDEVTSNEVTEIKVETKVGKPEADPHNCPINRRFVEEKLSMQPVGCANLYELALAICAECECLHTVDNAKSRVLLGAYKRDGILAVAQGIVNMYDAYNKSQQWVTYTLCQNWRVKFDEDEVDPICLAKYDIPQTLGNAGMITLVRALRFYLIQTVHRAFPKNSDPAEWDIGKATYKIGKYPNVRHYSSSSFVTGLSTLMVYLQSLEKSLDPELACIKAVLKTASEAATEEISRKKAERKLAYVKSVAERKENQRGGVTKFSNSGGASVLKTAESLVAKFSTDEIKVVSKTIDWKSNYNPITGKEKSVSKPQVVEAESVNDTRPQQKSQRSTQPKSKKVVETGVNTSSASDTPVDNVDEVGWTKVERAPRRPQNAPPAKTNKRQVVVAKGSASKGPTQRPQKRS
jgi:hypothetical protein